MKVSVEMSPQHNPPNAVIYTHQMTDEIQRIMNIFSTADVPITAQFEEQIVILKPAEIYMVRVEGKDTVLYGQKKHYYSRKRLYEINNQIGSGFMQISKTTLINLSYMDSVETSFNGTLLLKMKNGCKDYVSRHYIKEFRQYLGI